MDCCCRCCCCSLPALLVAVAVSGSRDGIMGGSWSSLSPAESGQNVLTSSRRQSRASACLSSRLRLMHCIPETANSSDHNMHSVAHRCFGDSESIHVPELPSSLSCSRQQEAGTNGRRRVRSAQSWASFFMSDCANVVKPTQRTRRKEKGGKKNTQHKTVSGRDTRCWVSSTPHLPNSVHDGVPLAAFGDR